VHVCTVEGLVFGWGRNDRGQLGIGKKAAVVNSPTRLKSLADKKVLMTASGQTHSLFLTDLGEVLACGFNEFGELGCGMQSLMVEKLQLSDFRLENGDFDEEAFMAHQRQ
jgi:alpha-tubulin suppressor-like RCC1 family protein